MVIFSGGESKKDTDLLAETKAIHAGNGFGSIVGRNFFQRKESDAKQIIEQMQQVYLK